MDCVCGTGLFLRNFKGQDAYRYRFIHTLRKRRQKARIRNRLHAATAFGGYIHGLGENKDIQFDLNHSLF